MCVGVHGRLHLSTCMHVFTCVHTRIHCELLSACVYYIMYVCVQVRVSVCE